MLCDTLDVVVMKRHAFVIGSHTGLRTMMLARARGGRDVGCI